MALDVSPGESSPKVESTPVLPDSAHSSGRPELDHTLTLPAPHGAAHATPLAGQPPAGQPFTGTEEARVATRQRLGVSSAVGLATLLLYVYCLSPTVTYTGDCGELISASYRLGIAHPTGYPLYCLLGRVIASVVPWGEVGWRYNLLSALLGALAVGLVTATVHRLTVDPADLANVAARQRAAGGGSGESMAVTLCPTISAGMLLGGFYYMGTQCVIAEVYALNATLLAALLYSAVAWHQEGDWRWAYTTTLLVGVALTAHLSCIFMMPGLLLYGGVQHRDRFNQPRGAWGRRAAVLLTLPLLAFALTLYLPLRSSLYPPPPHPPAWWPLDWTHPVNLANWYAHITAHQYHFHLIKEYEVTPGGHLLHVPWFAQPLSAMPAKLWAQLNFITMQYLWLTPFLAVGAVQACTSGRGSAPSHSSERSGGRWLGALLLLTFAGNVGVEINYDVSDVSNFFFPAYIMMAVWMALGLALFLRVAALAGAWLSRRTSQPLWQWRVTTLAWLSVAGTVVVQWWVFAGAASFRGDTTARDAALERATAAEQLAASSGRTPSLLLMEDDSLWSFWYAHYVLGRAPRVNTPWGRWVPESGSLLGLVTGLQRSGPVALTHFYEDVDRRFPYVMLTPSGNLCLASRRALPPPATPFGSGPPNSGSYPGGIIRARFRRTPWSRSQQVVDLPPEDVAGMTATEVVRLKKEGIVNLKRDDLSAFEIDFIASAAMLRKLARAPDGAALDGAAPVAQAGWIEVLMGRSNFLQGTPPPTQDEVKVVKTMIPPVRVWKQRRRLILPRLARPGTAWHVAVPLYVQGEAPSALYKVWTRLTTSPHDTTTPWKRTDFVSLIHK